MARGFDHITTWVFDLDHTLYPPDTSLFPQIEARMTAWIADFLRVHPEEAEHLRHLYWERHGTTLAGLMREHDMPAEPFLSDVHEIDFSVLTPNPALRAALRALPGRRIIYTNGTVGYAGQVLERLELSDLWDAVYGVEEADLVPKPHADAFEKVFGLDGFERGRAAMFEDTVRNLAVPHAMGLTCVQVATPHEDLPHVHHHTEDLAAFLRDITPLAGGRGGA